MFPNISSKKFLHPYFLSSGFRTKRAATILTTSCTLSLADSTAAGTGPATMGAREMVGSWLRSPMMLSHANVSRAMACFEHSNFFKVTAPEARPGQLRPGAHRRQKGRVGRCSPEGGPADPAQGPTTSFLIATT